MADLYNTRHFHISLVIIFIILFIASPSRKVFFEELLISG